LIAAPHALSALKERREFQDALTFADTDALRAFAAIAREQAQIVVLESAFAASSRGAALINRIKSDPLLGDCDVQIVMGVDVPAASETPGQSVFQADHAAPMPLDDPRPAAVSHDTVPEPAAESAMSGVDILIDGSTATLVELSTTGAQVISASSLKPQQRVRVTLPGSTPLQVTGEIAWAMFEMPAGGPRYRAAVTFVSPDTARIAAFLDANRR
jgi:hypothetical protein